MAVNLEICIKENQSTTEKGRILENLTAKILRVQQYDVVETVRVTGMEVDVLAKHRITGAKILVECKAWDSALPADVISKLLGNVMLRGAAAGWLITTGPLSKDAKGIKSEWETDTNPNRSSLAFYTDDRILELLLNSNEIASLEAIRGSVEKSIKLGDDASLLITTNRMVWVVPLLDPASNFSSTVIAFDARTGARITQSEILDDLKAHRNSYSTFQWLSTESVDAKPSKTLNEEFNSIVPVISGDDWTDYRPARPEDFVGRKTILSDMITFLESATIGKSPTRLFSLKAPSGMGKSSVVLKLIETNFDQLVSDIQTSLSDECWISTQDLITELSLNAFQHGNAKQIVLNIMENELQISDDGTIFDINELKKPKEILRGGNWTLIQYINDYPEINIVYNVYARPCS